MGISTFPAASGGGAVNNDFVVDLNDTTNNVIDLPRQYVSGSYNIALSSGDTSFDIYFLDENGDSVAYSNSASIVASAGFQTVVILGVATDEIITFTFAGAVADANSEGDEPGAGAYLTSISPSDLPTADDTATVIGGNFSTAVEIFFDSGTVTKAAKNITRTDSTALIVTRPDDFDPALDPWDVRAINPGVTPPTGSNAHILAGTVDAGAVPVFQTTSPLPQAQVNQVYAATVVATDADGSVTYSITAGSVPAGLSFNGATGVISGTPTAGAETFTVEALDDGGNSNTREFDLPVQLATGGSVTTDGNYTVHTFNSSSDFIALGALNAVEYIILAGGGGGGAGFGNGTGGGGGGGGLLSSISGFSSGSASAALSSINISAGTYAVAVGAGGAGGDQAGPGASGTDTSFATVGTAIGGGGAAGQNTNTAASSGGSGGGDSANSNAAGAGTTGQGFSGGLSNSGLLGGGGGGTSEQGKDSSGNLVGADGGKGTHNFLDQRGWGAGGGGGAANQNNDGGSGGGSTGNDQTNLAGDGGTRANTSGADGFPGVANFGGGGGGVGIDAGNFGDGGAGGSGKVVIRYEA